MSEREFIPHSKQEVGMKFGQNNDRDERYYLNQVLNFFRTPRTIRLKWGQPIVIELKESPILTSQRSESRSMTPSPSHLYSSLPRKRKRRNARKRRINKRRRRRTDIIKAFPRSYLGIGGKSVVAEDSKTRELYFGATEPIVTSSKGGKISVTNLRKIALEHLPSSSILREVIMAEGEKLTPEEFLGKLDVWLLLFKKEIEG